MTLLLLARESPLDHSWVMVYKMSPTRQQTAIGEGLALGVIALGVEATSAASLEVDIGFMHAWREWAYRDRFPQVRGDLERNHIKSILHMSSRRRGPVAAWDMGRVATPYLSHPDWTFEETAETIEGDVPLDGWMDLAALFLERAALK